jgi:hypothetical protein
MNYYLNDIKSLLTTEGYTNIFINRLQDTSTSTSLENAIFLMAEGGNNDGTQIEYTRDFTIYVRRTTQSASETDANAIWKYLNYFTGGVTGANTVNIKRITTRNSPYPYTVDNSTNINEFIITMTAHIIDSDFLTIK